LDHLLTTKTVKVIETKPVSNLLYKLKLIPAFTYM
jgi:hypothetical protein